MRPIMASRSVHGRANPEAATMVPMIANRSDEDRYLLQVHYAKRMITQKFPPYLNKFKFDPDIIAQCNPRQRRLLGDHVSSNYD